MKDHYRQLDELRFPQGRPPTFPLVSACGGYFTLLAINRHEVPPDIAVKYFHDQLKAGEGQNGLSRAEFLEEFQKLMANGDG